MARWGASGSYVLPLSSKRSRRKNAACFSTGRYAGDGKSSSHFQSYGAGIVNASGTVFLGQRQHALNTTHRGLAVLAVHAAAERADLLTGEVGAAQ